VQIYAFLEEFSFYDRSYISDWIDKGNHRMIDKDNHFLDFSTFAKNYEIKLRPTEIEQKLNNLFIK
jgi:hypothetical protein